MTRTTASLAAIALLAVTTAGLSTGTSADAAAPDCAAERTYCPTDADSRRPDEARGVDGGVGGQRLPDGSAPQTLWIGDSLTKRAAPAVAQQHPEFYVDYKGGRPVKAANQLIERFVTTVNERPRNLVFALGSNNSPDAWTEARLRAAVDKVPASTNIYFLRAVRPTAGEEAKDRNLQQYDVWSKRVRDSRPRTYIVNWRQAVLRDLDVNDGDSTLLEDNVHQTGSAFGGKTPGPGVDTFVGLFLDKMASTGGIRRSGR